MTAPHPHRWQMLPVILSATFMALFDFFVVNVAAPSLQRDLNAGEAALELIVGGYAFSYASGLVTGGRLGDRFGYRRMFMLGMTGFTLASLLCGLAQTSWELVVARLLQGGTAAVMVPQVLALITSVFPAQERPRAVSYMGVAIGLGSISGQIFGGLLLDWNLFDWGWRTVFLVNLPVGVVALFAASRLLPGHRGAQTRRLDPIGAVGLSVALGLALVPLVLGRTENWPLWTWICMAASLPVLALVVWWQRVLTVRGGEPLIDLSLFRVRVFSAGLAVNFAFMAFFSSFTLASTLFLQLGLHLSPLNAGLTFGPLGVIFSVTSVLTQRLIARWGSKVITYGSLTAVLGLLVMLVTVTASGDHISALRLIPGMMIIGLGNGLAFPALVGAVISQVHVRQAGGAAGILTTTQQFASAAGVAVLGTIFFSLLGDHPNAHHFRTSLQASLVLGVVLISLASGLTVLLRPRTATAVPAKSVEVAELVS